MKTIVKKLSPEVVADIERISYELEARKTIITEMISMDMDITTDAFAKYQGELVAYKVMFEEAKKEIERQYVADIPGSQKWQLDYSTCELTITVDEAMTCG